MVEKTKVPMICDTVLIDGQYQVERRTRVERRKNKGKWIGYDRRKSRDPRLTDYKPIDDNV